MDRGFSGQPRAGLRAVTDAIPRDRVRNRQRRKREAPQTRIWLQMLPLWECADRGPSGGQRPSAEKGVCSMGGHGVWKDVCICADDTEGPRPSEDEKLRESNSWAWRGKSQVVSVLLEAWEKAARVPLRSWTKKGGSRSSLNVPPLSCPHCVASWPSAAHTGLPRLQDKRRHNRATQCRRLTLK